MTIDEAIYCMQSYLPDKENDHCINCPYYGTVKVPGEKNIWVCQSNIAHQMAVEALRKMKKG